MPGTTTNGFPYPLGTDPISDGDDQIKALAEYTDAKTICWALAYKGANQIVNSGATAWFADLTTGKVAGGMAIAADGITVPVKGWYWVTATALLSGAVANVAGQTLIGDGTTVWAYGVAQLPVTTFSASGNAQTAVLLNAGAKVKWGLTAAGGNITVSSPTNFSSLHARLLMPVP